MCYSIPSKGGKCMAWPVIQCQSFTRRSHSRKVELKHSIQRGSVAKSSLHCHARPIHYCLQIIHCFAIISIQSLLGSCIVEGEKVRTSESLVNSDTLALATLVKRSMIARVSADPFYCVFYVESRNWIQVMPSVGCKHWRIFAVRDELQATGIC